MMKRFIIIALFLALSLTYVSILATTGVMRNLNILLPGDKERIVDSLDAAGVFTNEQMLSQYPDSVREPHQLGFKTGAAGISLPVNTSVLFIRSAPPGAQQLLGLANLIDSVQIGTETSAWDDSLSMTVRLSDQIATWLTAHQAITVQRVLQRSLPGETFSVPRVAGMTTYDLSTYYQVTFADTVLVDTILASLQAVTGIEDAYLVGKVLMLSGNPPDPHVPDCQYTDTLNTRQWYLKKSRLINGIDSIGINAFGAWDIVCDSSASEGKVRIGLPDLGFGSDPSFHPRLRRNIVQSTVVFSSNYENHGTAVAGVIGAATDDRNNGIPLVPDEPSSILLPWGVAPRANLIVTDIDDDPSGYMGDLQYLVDSTNARIINFSWKVALRNEPLEALLYKAFYEKHIVLVAGSGNCDIFSPCPHRILPAAHPCVIAVGGVDGRGLNIENWGYNALAAPSDYI